MKESILLIVQSLIIQVNKYWIYYCGTSRSPEGHNRIGHSEELDTSLFKEAWFREFNYAICHTCIDKNTRMVVSTTYNEKLYQNYTSEYEEHFFLPYSVY